MQVSIQASNTLKRTTTVYNGQAYTILLIALVNASTTYTICTETLVYCITLHSAHLALPKASAAYSSKQATLPIAVIKIGEGVASTKPEHLSPLYGGALENKLKMAKKLRRPKFCYEQNGR